MQEISNRIMIIIVFLISFIINFYLQDYAFRYKANQVIKQNPNITLQEFMEEN